MQRSALCRSRRELSNEYLLAKIGVDTAENELLQVLFKIIQYYSIVSLEEPQQVDAAALELAVQVRRLVHASRGWARNEESSRSESFLFLFFSTEVKLR